MLYAVRLCPGRRKPALSVLLVLSPRARGSLTTPSAQESTATAQGGTAQPRCSRGYTARSALLRRQRGSATGRESTRERPTTEAAASDSRTTRSLTGIDRCEKPMSRETTGPPRTRGDRPVRTAVDPNPAPPTRGSCLLVLSRVAGERSSLVGSLGRRRAGLGLKATGVIAAAAG